MRNKRWALAAAAAMLAAVLLGGCAAERVEMTGGYAPATNAPMEQEMPAADVYVGEAYSTQDAAGEAGVGALTLPQDDRKIILTAWLTLETLDYEGTCARLQQNAAEAGGYISATDISGSTAYDYRSASFTLRIPTDRYSEFVELAGEAGTLVNRSESTEEVTEQYTDIEARLKALRTQETRLLEMMEAAESLADLILVQEQLSNVQYEIEYYTASQRRLDNQISYSTVHVAVNEVRQITEPVEDSYGSKIAAAFRESWRNAGRFFQNLGIGIVWLLPLILVVVIALVVVLVAVRRRRKKRAESPPAEHPMPPPPTGAPYAPYPPYPAPRIGPPEAGEPRAHEQRDESED